MRSLDVRVSVSVHACVPAQAVGLKMSVLFDACSGLAAV